MVFQYYQVLGGCTYVVFFDFQALEALSMQFCLQTSSILLTADQTVFLQRFWGALLWSMVWSQTCGTKETFTCQVSGNQKISWGLGVFFPK